MGDPTDIPSVDEPVPSGDGPDAAPNRRNLAVVAAGVLLLVIGAVVHVLGSGAASSAGDDLTHARRRLDTQQAATRRARRCEHDLRAGLPQVISAGDAVLNTATQITAQDQQETQAAHDGQTAGSQARIGDYNNSVDRANAAANASNGLLAPINQQLGTFNNNSQALQTACPV